jgi:hypothetical protein
MDSRTWRNLGLAYLAFFLVAIAIARHGLEGLARRGPMSPLELILAAPMLFGYGIYAAATGSVLWRWSSTERSENPVAFWCMVAFFVLFGVFLFSKGIHDLRQ